MSCPQHICTCFYKNFSEINFWTLLYNVYYVFQFALLSEWHADEVRQAKIKDTCCPIFFCLTTETNLLNLTFIWKSKERGGGRNSYCISLMDQLLYSEITYFLIQLSHHSKVQICTHILETVKLGLKEGK